MGILTFPDSPYYKIHIGCKFDLSKIASKSYTSYDRSSNKTTNLYPHPSIRICFYFILYTPP